MGCGTPIPLESSPLWPQSSNTQKSASPVRRQFIISDLGQDGRRAATKNGIKNTQKYMSPDSIELLLKSHFCPENTTISCAGACVEEYSSTRGQVYT
jgi:hypothetical protein